MNKYKQEYLRYRHILGFQKSKKYLKWVKEKYPNKDLHHLLGSVKGKKYTDYLVYPFEHNYHLNVVEKQKAYYFCNYKDKAISLFTDYVESELKIEIDYTKYVDYFDDPETLKEFFEFIKEHEG